MRPGRVQSRVLLALLQRSHSEPRSKLSAGQELIQRVLLVLEADLHALQILGHLGRQGGIARAGGVLGLGVSEVVRSARMVVLGRGGVCPLVSLVLVVIVLIIDAVLSSL